MSSEKQKATDKQIGNYKEGSGSKYHKEHASHVPDYGANIVDPNAAGSINPK